MKVQIINDKLILVLQELFPNSRQVVAGGGPTLAQDQMVGGELNYPDWLCSLNPFTQGVLVNARSKFT